MSHVELALERVSTFQAAHSAGKRPGGPSALPLYTVLNRPIRSTVLVSSRLYKIGALRVGGRKETTFPCRPWVPGPSHSFRRVPSGRRDARCAGMDPSSRWRNLPSGPSLKHLTDPSYGIPREQQKPALQELTRAHVESFNYAVREGLSHAVQVSAPPSQASLRSELPAQPASLRQAGGGEGPGGAGGGRQRRKWGRGGVWSAGGAGRRTEARGLGG